MVVQVPPQRVAVRDRRGWPPPAPLFVLDLVVLAGLAVVFALWITGPGSAHLTSSAPGAAIGAGRLAGLLAADLLLIQALLMARIPLLERHLGTGVLAGRHRIVGLASFALLCLHIVCLGWGYAVLGSGNGLAQLRSLLLDGPGMVLAVAAAGALALVTLTSIRIARRRLRYQSWHLLHLYAYLGIGLALPHQLWTGADFVGSPAAHAYWLGLHGLTLAAVATFRVLLPLLRSGRRSWVIAAAAATAVLGLLRYPTSTVGGPPRTAAAIDIAAVSDLGNGMLQVDGPTAQSQYGPVQVRIHYRDGRIEHIEALHQPAATPADRAVNTDAIGRLRDEVLIEQSAQIDTISGATQTSAAYRTSLQAALDAAHAAPEPSTSVAADPPEHHG